MNDRKKLPFECLADLPISQMTDCRNKSIGGRLFYVEQPNHYNLDFSAYIFETILSKVALEKFLVNVELDDFS